MPKCDTLKLQILSLHLTCFKEVLCKRKKEGTYPLFLFDFNAECDNILILLWEEFEHSYFLVGAMRELMKEEGI